MPIPAVTCLALPAGAAAADVYQQVLLTYERADTIPACRFTAGQLQTALNGIDTYGAQYFADFTDAIQAALAARAGGECSAAPARAAVPLTTALAPSDNVAPLPSVTAATSGGLPAALIVLAALAVGLTLAGALTAGARALSARRERVTGPRQP